MNKSQRIYFSTGNTGNFDSDKYIKVRLEQKVQTLEFMSMSFSTEDAYQNFNSDYGVLVGRVIANNGIGVPNAKISIFIPITDDDKNDSDIYSVYPYETPRDVNNEGKRYNLLPRVSQIEQETGVYKPKQPFGSFPIKPEIVINETLLNVYKKYYKFTTVTNSVGDYMIFGVPIGTQTVHMSVDITDIGKYSMSPLSMVNNLGYSPNLFTEDKTQIKPATNLEDLPHIETQEISVNIIPFWGDKENFEIGITRQDFRVKAQLINTFVIFGSAFTDNEDSMWTRNFDDNRNHARELYRITDGKYLGIVTKRPANVTEKIYYYSNDITDSEINSGAKGADDMKLLDPSEYVSYKQDGNFVFLIRANRNKYIQDETGTDILVNDDYNGGVYANFRGFVTFEITKEDAPMNLKDVKIGADPRLLSDDSYYANPFRIRFKFPQKANDGQSFDDTEGTKTTNWRKDDFIFDAGKIYTVSKFHGTTQSNDEDNSDYDVTSNQFVATDKVNRLNLDPYWNVGVIATDNTVGDGNSYYNFPSNGKNDNGEIELFGANWLNFSIHFSQIGYSNESGDQGSFASMYSNTNFTSKFKSKHFYGNNEQLIAANQTNTKWFGRSDLHWTDFVEVSKEVIIGINNETNDIFGFKSTELPQTLRQKVEAIGFRNGTRIPTGWSNPCPYKGGMLNGIPSTNPVNKDPNIYFFKGIGETDCIEYLISLGLV